jgi:hypothetical protein
MVAALVRLFGGFLFLGAGLFAGLLMCHPIMEPEFSAVIGLALGGAGAALINIGNW